MGALIGISTVQAQKSPQDMDRFIDALMKKMTVEEKIGQLNLPVTGDITTGQAKSSDVAAKIEKGLVGGLFNLKGVDRILEVQKLAVEKSRLGIPLLFGMDVIHGYETIFPIPLGLSCTWDMAAIEKSARIAAIEASADGISWTFSPMVDISRDPRWGRVSEGSGEDPFLGGAIAQAMVYGYQGANLQDQLRRNDEIMACVKHFALYGAGEAGRDYNTVDMSRNRMFNEFMYPYEAAVEAGVGSVMASFNEIDGIPATGNKWLLSDLLRGQWGFEGFVVTDFTGIAEMIEHGVGDLQTVSALALNAGVDMDMVSEGFVGTLMKSIKEGKVRMGTLNTACRRILEAKYKLGLFDNPYKYCDVNRPKRDIFTKEHRDAARKIASESFVLLKNAPLAAQKNAAPVLPLKKQGTVAVIGPLGNTRSNMPGTWSVAARLNDYPSLYEGLKEMMAGKVNITYAKGSNLISDAAYEERATMFGRSLNRDNRTDKEMLDEALRIIRGLLDGESVTFTGRHYRVNSAKLWDLPARRVPIATAVSGSQSVNRFGPLSDAMIAVEPNEELCRSWDATSGGSRKIGQLPIAWGRDRDAVRKRVWEQFRWFAGGWKVNAELPGPAGFAGATQFVRQEDVASSIPCGPDVQPIVDAVRGFEEAGFTDLALVQIGGDPTQDEFFEFAEAELLPALRKATT